MIAHGKDIKVFTGNSNPKLAQNICQELGIPLGDSEVGAFSDGENFASIYETVRGSDVFVVQSTCSFRKDDKSGSVNDALMELLIMIDALRRASAGRITAVIPYFGYARQDRKTKPRDPISAKLVANLIAEAGADRVLTMDLHANQIQGFFDIPVDNLLGSPILLDYVEALPPTPDMDRVSEESFPFLQRLYQLTGEDEADRIWGAAMEVGASEGRQMLLTGLALGLELGQELDQLSLSR